MASDTGNLYQTATWKILKRKPIEVAPEKDGIFRLSPEDGSWLTQVIHTYPGSSKSWAATQFVTEAWQERGLKGLYLMLSHQAINERMDRIRRDGNDKHWSHWRAHNDGCERDKFNSNGYLGFGSCTCDAKGQLVASGPTLAPIEYILPRLPGETEPLIKAAGEFDYWVVDEIDFRRLLGHEQVRMDEVRVVADTHPDQWVRILCGAMCDLAGTLKVGERINGNRMYDVLAQVLKNSGRSASALEYGLLEAKLPMAPWIHGSDTSLPRNFPPVLAPIIVEELSNWESGGTIVPRIHIVRTGSGAELRVWWPKGRGLMEPDDKFFPPYTFILDATADEKLLGEVFPYPDTEVVPSPAWPENLLVHQWSDDLVSRSTLGMRFGRSAFSTMSIQTRKRWYDRIGDALADSPADSTVGIVTHQTIEEEARNVLENMGFQHVRSLHYGAERGSNSLEDVRILVLLGLPIPNAEAFIEEAQGFLQVGYSEQEWVKKGQFLEMTNGDQTPVEVGGYWKGDLGRYYAQKCQFGLYQALHRIRPYIDREYDRYIYIFTNMPIPGVKVYGLLRTEKDKEILARRERVVEAIMEACELGTEIMAPELAQIVAIEGDDNHSTIARWIQRNGNVLAKMAGATYEKGKGGHHGRFLRQPSP